MVNKIIKQISENKWLVEMNNGEICEWNANQPERLNPEDQCKHELEEYEGSSFCDKCKMP